MWLRTLSRYEEDVVDHDVPGLSLLGPADLDQPRRHQVMDTHYKIQYADYELTRTQEGMGISDADPTTT